MSNAERTFSDTCGECGAPLYQGFARCQNPSCGALRDEFRGFEGVVVAEKGRCLLSGAPTDVRLPGGDYLWAPYFIDYVEGGLIDLDLSYSPKFYEGFPHLRPRG
jgi:hypothetical protein